MVITPNTDVILLKCPLELDEKNQLSFTSKSAQYNYFNSLPKLVVGDDFTYQRKDSYIRVDELIDNIYQYNYIMYRNDAYSSKWFYAFIERMEYVNDRVTNVYIKTDVFQTWQFDLDYKRTFVEREHTNDDTVGNHTIDEGLETGEYVINYVKEIDITSSSQYGTKSPFCIIGVSEVPTSSWNGVSSITTPIGSGTKQQGVPTALQYLIVSTDNIQKFSTLYDKNSKADAIATVFVIPAKMVEILGRDELLTLNTIYLDGNDSIALFEIDANEDAIDFGTYTSYRPTTIDGYVPKNNKLFTYPYCYSRLTNNGGVDVVYRWEDFADRNATYKVQASIVQGMSVKAYPVNYLKTEGKDAYVYGITGQKFPTCAWNSDFYLSWVNQQGSNLALQTATSVGSSVLGMIGGATSGTLNGAISSVGGGALNIMSTIGNTMQRIREAELVPAQTRGNINSGDVNFSIGKSGFTIYDMNIKAEYARQIDDYFSMFGYKTNRVKVPNVTGRYNWNYVKTVGCYIEADIPQDDLQEIKNMFDNGLTIWHRANTFMNYSQSNPIV